MHHLAFHSFKFESHKFFFSIKRSIRFKGGPTILVQNQLAPKTLVQKFEQEIHKHSWRGNNTPDRIRKTEYPGCFTGKLRRISRSFSKGPNANIDNSLDNRLQGCSLTQSQWHMRSCFPSCLKRTLSKLERLLECLTSCRFGINLTSPVPSMKEHPVMTSSIVSLWRLKSKSGWKPISCFSEIEFGRTS